MPVVSLDVVSYLVPCWGPGDGWEPSSLPAGLGPWWPQDDPEPRLPGTPC